MIVITFVLLSVIGGIVQFAVPVNHDMVDYLPDDAPSIEATEVMEEEFDGEVANTRVMVKDLSIQEAVSYKEKLKTVDGVSEVTWLDDVMDIKKPIEAAPDDTVDSYYKNDKALFSLHIKEGMEVKATNAIYELIGEENAMSGNAVDTAISQQKTSEETLFAAAILIPAIILILLLSTSSWVEPVFFLTAIGVSVLINLGTNIFVGEVSFITQAVAPILQLAVSLDYAIFLLHSFADYRKQTSNIEEAMKKAVKRSFPAIAASASTTFFGFMALGLMDFEIGADLGLNLVKGILLSFISVIVFLPAFTLLFYKWIDKSAHRQLLPSSFHIGNKLLKLRVPALVIVLLLIVPAFLAQSETDFIYGMGEHPDKTRAGEDTGQIEDTFGKYTPIIALVPKGDIGRETEFVQELEDLDYVKGIDSYVTRVGAGIPSEYVDESVKEQFFSENYSRLIINSKTDTEGNNAFDLVHDIRATATDYYGDDSYTLGESATLYDMKHIVEEDNKVVNILTVVAIAIVLLLTFRSISIPVVLLLTIQSAVWINLAVPYFTDSPLVYIGYLIISTVQLAATVDYAILFTEDYTGNRKEMSAKEAIRKTIDEKTFSIGVSASILSSVGFILWGTSSDPIVSSIGLLLGRGALLAFVLVVLFLPAMLLIFDWVIEKTTWKANFYKRK